LSSADKRGSSDADVRTSGVNNFGFFEICGVSARTTRFDLVRTFFGIGGWGQFFAIFSSKFGHFCGRKSNSLV